MVAKDVVLRNSILHHVHALNVKFPSAATYASLKGCHKTELEEPVSSIKSLRWGGFIFCEKKV